MPYSLRLIEDVLAPGTRHEAAARPIARVVYLLDGTVEALESDRARLASGAITAGGGGARPLPWGALRPPPPPPAGRVAPPPPPGAAPQGGPRIPSAPAQLPTGARGARR